MGTNYYVKQTPPVCTNPCPHCACEKEPLVTHIGKNSEGWEFSFSAMAGPRSWQEWKAFLQGKTLITEYNTEIPLEEFITLVEDSRKAKGVNHYHYCKESGWLRDTDFLDPEGWCFNEEEFS